MERIQKTVDQFGGLDILVNDAGVRVMATLEETTDEAVDLRTDVNFRGTLYGCKAAAPLMKARR